MSTRDLFVSAERLERAVVISLFTWRRAESSDPVDDDELYGWWGDSFPDRPSDRIGSRLWLLRRRTLVAQTLLDARAYALQALEWMVEDQIVRTVDVTAVDQGRGKMDLTVVLGMDEEDRVLTFSDVLRMIDDGI